jgi:hypothetical protein
VLGNTRRPAAAAAVALVVYTRFTGADCCWSGVAIDDDADSLLEESLGGDSWVGVTGLLW